MTEEDFQKLKAEGKIIEDRGYETVYGLWRYFTADNMDLEEKTIWESARWSLMKIKGILWRGKDPPHLYRSGRRRTPEAGNREGRDAGSTEIRRNVPEISGRCTGFQ